MHLSDILLKAKVNMALVRDPRVSSLDIGVHPQNGVVILKGDLDKEEECQAAEEIARGVEGVTEVRNELTCGIGERADTTERIREGLQEKLQEEWNSLPDRHALTQADYVRWALWLIYKFRVPASVLPEDPDRLKNEIIESALTLLAHQTGIPKGMLALEMLSQAESIALAPAKTAPELDNSPLTATSIVTGQ